MYVEYEAFSHLQILCIFGMKRDFQWRQREAAENFSAIDDYMDWKVGYANVEPDEY